MPSLRIYCDASGHERDQSHVVVAGFVSSLGDWLDFEVAWKERLDRDGLPYFHAVDFAHSTGPFASGWKDDEARRIRLSADLMGIVQSHVYRKMASGVSIANLQRHQASSDTLKALKINAFVLGARTCIADFARWCRDERYFPSVGYVFEEGDIGHGALGDLVTSHGYPPPSFQHKLDRLTPTGLQKGAVPLQAADWLAYEMFQAAKRLFMNDPRDRSRPLRWGWTEFDKIPGVAGFYSPVDLMHLQDNLEAYERREINGGGTDSGTDGS
jgi:hypothetical protein